MPLSLQNVWHGYGRASVLRGLSLRVEKGEWLGVIGANGSGRSTLARVATGLLQPKRGQVLFEGRDIWSRPNLSLRRQLGLVMQRAEDQFLGDTVYDDVAFGPRQVKDWEAEIRGTVAGALRHVGFDLHEIGDRSPLELSGGQRRRLAVAGILALNPAVLVLDEPFAGLDGESRADMTSLLVRLRSEGMAILTLTADLESVSDANEIALVVDGVIGLRGAIADFVANQRMCREAGILLPDRIRIALELRERGWNVPVLGPPGALESAIAREWKQRKHA